MTTLHYADNLDTPRNNAFRKSFALTYKANADVYAVQGYDAAQMLAAGLAAVKGDIEQARRADRRDAQGDDRQPARQVHAVAGRTTRCRTSTCARPRARTTSTARGGEGAGRPGPRLQAVKSRLAPPIPTGGAGRPFSCALAVDLATFLVQCLNAVQYGLLLFLVASGLTLIFGIMGVINLAHGSFYMIGAYLAFALAPLFGDWFLTKLLAGVRALGGLRLPARMGLLQLPLPARAPAAGADDLRADPGLRGTALDAGRQRRARRAGADLAGRRLPLGELMTYPVVPPVRLGRLHRGRRSACTWWSTAPGWA